MTAAARNFMLAVRSADEKMNKNELVVETQEADKQTKVGPAGAMKRGVRMEDGSDQH
jgi:hypothetical protein